MQVEKHKVVSIDYTLKDDLGQIIDSSSGNEPLIYIQGIGSLIPGLEAALEGKIRGNSLSVSIEPGLAYGERDDQLVQTIPKEYFTVEGEITPGMQFQTENQDGRQIVTVVEVTQEHVTIDTNHPLAGETLHFDVQVLDVRDATQEELAHGHVHGPGGHHH